MKRALITGITGQDGSYLSEFLLEKGYEVHGLIRRTSTTNNERIVHIQDRLSLHYGDITDGSGMKRLVEDIEPDEVYNLAAQSNVRISFDAPVYTADVVGLGTLRMLEAVRSVKPTIRFYQASSSEIYGNTTESPQNENTPCMPASPYACAKYYAHRQVINYREGYGLHASSGILFNHESPRRGDNFVTRKITQGIARILCGKEKELRLGNLETKRDWGYAKDYVEAMWMMLQRLTPDDYVIATGETHSVAEFLDEASRIVNLDWHDFVVIDPVNFRPSDVRLLLGDATKAHTKLGWYSRTSFHELVYMMLKADLEHEGLSL